MLRGADNNKDQTCFLSPFARAVAEKTMFLRTSKKPEVRGAVYFWNVQQPEKDSAGICFVV